MKKLRKEDLKRSGMCYADPEVHPTTIRHPFIPKLRFYFEDENYIYYMQDYVPGSKLLNVLPIRNENTVKFYAAQLGSVIAYFHSLGVCCYFSSILVDSQSY